MAEASTQLMQRLRRERIERARQMDPLDKLFAGVELFDSACAWMAVGIRHQFPDADESRVQEILRERLALTRRPPTEDM